MVMLILSMLCIGAALGVRFKVLILVPAIGLAFTVILAGGVARGDSALAILIAAVLVSSGLQIGYLCCVIARHGIAQAEGTHKAALQAKSAH
jgi:hypothetical protein